MTIIIFCIVYFADNLGGISIYIVNKTIEIHVVLTSIRRIINKLSDKE